MSRVTVSDSRRRVEAKRQSRDSQMLVQWTVLLAMKQIRVVVSIMMLPPRPTRVHVYQTSKLHKKTCTCVCVGPHLLLRTVHKDAYIHTSVRI